MAISAVRCAVILEGDYLQTKRPPTEIVCKGYDAPYPSGRFQGSMPKGAIFGPVELVLRTTRYTTVLVDGWWINVIEWYTPVEVITQAQLERAAEKYNQELRAKGANKRRKCDRVWRKPDHFAYVVQRAVVNAWYQRGWMDSVSASRREALDAAGDRDEDRILWI